MKVLFTHRYFWPDSPPYAAMLRMLTAGISNSGHDVHVFTSYPSYRDNLAQVVSKEQILDGVSVWRGPVIAGEKRWIGLRFLNVLIYCTTLFVHVIRVRPDIVVAGTFPPVFAAWTASLAARIVLSLIHISEPTRPY